MAKPSVALLGVLAGCGPAHRAPSPPPPRPRPLVTAPAPAASAPPAATWRWWTGPVDGGDVRLCLPATPIEQQSDDGSVRFTGLALRGRAGPLSIELMQSSVGPFPLAANVPDPYAWDELVRTEVISDSSWLVASRAKHGGPTRKVVVRIADRFGEDLLCTAEEDVDAAHPDAAVFADLEGICRTMQLATGAGPCAPAQTTPPP